MDAVVQDKIVAIIKERFEDQVMHSAMLNDFLTITLKSAKIVDVIRHLYDHPEMKFQYLTTLCGIHYPEVQQISIMYQLHNLYNNVR
jgi:NADH-quinone oxidoreductase subunit C